MGTSVENSLTNFDLDLLLGPASTSISENTEIINHAYQGQNLGNSGITNHDGYGYQVQNMGNTETTDYVYAAQNIGNTGLSDHGYNGPNVGNSGTIGHKIQNMENKIFLPGDMVKKSDYDTLKNKHDVNLKNYESLKNQFAKLASDFSTLNVQNQNNAMAALNAENLNEELKKKLVAHKAEISALQKKQEIFETVKLAHTSSVSQFTSLVNNLETEVANLKNDVISEKMNGKDGRKMISSLKKNNDTLAEHLCILACIIEGRSPLDKEARRLIKKYCKNGTSGSNKSVESESFESQSIDTGRGSSLAFSDGDRSISSPAYSFINFSPISTGTITRNEQPKMKNASSSPPPMIKTIDISTSPIIFDEIVIPPPLIKTADVSTSPIHHESRTPGFERFCPSRTKMLDITTSPVEFADWKTPVAITKTSNVATSPIEFAERKIPLAKTSDVSISPVEFADWKTPVAITKTSNMATSPIEFAERKIPLAKTSDISTSPVEFADWKTRVDVTKTSNIATSPINVDDRRIPMTKTLDIATSPVKFADTKIPEAMTKISDIATSPVESGYGRIPVPVKKTLNIISSSIEFADTLEAKTKSWHIVTRPIEFAEANIPAIKTLDMTKPIECADAKIQAILTKTLDMTRPIECPEVKIPAIKTKTLDATVPDCAEAKITLFQKKNMDMTTSIKFAEAKIPAIKTNTLDMNRPVVCASVRSAISAITKTLDIVKSPKTENLLSTNSPNIQDKVKNPVSMSKHTDFVISSRENIIQMNDIKVKLNEIVSQNSHHSQNDEENDTEIKMILSKQSLNWDMLSPMSLTPEVDEETDQTQSGSDTRKEKSQEHDSINSMHQEIHKASEILIQSLYISGDEHSEDEIDREDCDFSNLVNENPQNVDPSNNNFNLIKNSAVENKQNVSIKHKNTTSQLEDDISELPTEISNKSYSKLNKSHGPSTKSKKLTNLQKIYKANMPKSKIKSQILLSVKKQCKIPTSNSISLIQHDLVLHTCNNNNPEGIKLTELNTKKLLFKNQDAVAEASKESLNCNFKKPQPLPESGLKINVIDSRSDSECGQAHTQTYPQPESVRNRVCKSTETHSKNKDGLPHTQTNLLPEAGQKQKACLSTATRLNNLSSPPHTQTNPLSESCAKERLSMSTETQTNRISVLMHTKTCSQLESGQKTVCMPTETKSSSISPHTQTKTLPESGSQKTKACTSTERQLDLISGFPHIQTNPLSTWENQFGRKRRLNMSMGSQCNTKYELSKAHTNLLPESDPSSNISNESISESDHNYSYSKPPRKRIARVGKNPPDLSSDQTNNIITNDRISSVIDTINYNEDGDESPPSKKIRAANDQATSNELDSGETRLPSINPQENKTKEAIIDNNKIKTIEMIKYSENGLRHLRQSTLNIDKARTQKKLDDNIHQISPTKSAPSNQTRNYADYNDLKMFTTQNDNCRKEQLIAIESDEWKRNIMDIMIFKYGSNAKPMKKPIYDDVVATKIETGVAKCVKSSQNPEMYKKDLHELVNVLKKQGLKKIMGGFMKFINDPARKADFIPKEGTKPNKGYHFRNTASQSVIALIDVFELLDKSGFALWKLVLDSCEYILFTLEKGATPVFDVIESVTNLYVNICKYHGNISKIWMFMLNAMYCLSFKAIPLIIHCLDVLPNILPYANAYRDPGIEPMIRSIVFLLHYYNCDDRFKRVEKLRVMLRNKYGYNLQDENETTILFMLRTAIINLTENAVERRILELTLLIVAKRRGTKWCHKNIVQKIILPMIKGEIEVSPSGKRFCLTIIGHILKPYKNEMTVHSEEVVNLLINMFEQPQPQEIKEDIICGLINMNMKTISDPINRCLFNWNPPSISPEFEEALAVYIQSKPLKAWQIVHQNHTEI